jgi:death-on-curing protein
MEIVFLSFAEVIEIHQDQIHRYGGESGLRDMELLKSALGMPSATFGGQFLHTDIYEMAAAYLFHLVQNHPFVDGISESGRSLPWSFCF